MASRKWRSFRTVIVLAAGCLPLACGPAGPAVKSQAGTTQTTGTQTTTTETTAPFVFDQKLEQTNLDTLVNHFGASAAVFAISQHGGPPTILTSGTWGNAANAVQPTDAFYVASLSKTFVGGLILALVDDHMIQLDDSLNHYGLDWPHGDIITVRQLLTHTSGLPPLGGDTGNGDRYAAQFNAFLQARSHNRISVADVLALVRNRPLLFPPGTATSYSNLNDILAAQIIEKVTGQTFAQALHHRLLDPLHLSATRVVPDDAVPARTIPTGVAFDEELLDAIGPAGNMVSNAADLIAWGNALLRDGSFLSVASHAMATSIGTGGTGVGTIGWGRPPGMCALQGCPPGAVFFAYGGTGSIPGVRTVLLYDHDNDTTIVAFANNQHAPADSMAPLTWFHRVIRT